MRTYLISRTPEMELILKAVERCEDSTTTVRDLVQMGSPYTEEHMRSLAADL